MILEFVAEFFHDGNHRQRRGIAQRAEGAAQHVLGDVAEQADILLGSAAVMKARHDLAAARWCLRGTGCTSRSFRARRTS